MSNKTSKVKTIINKGSSDSYMGRFTLVLFVIALIITGIITAAFGHQFGYYRGFSVAERSLNQEGLIKAYSSDDIEALNKKVDTLNDALNKVTKEKVLSLSNQVTMREKLNDIEVTNLQLNQLNQVYADALTKRGGLPLQILAAEIKPLPENIFEYRFDVAMLAKDGLEKQLTPKLVLLNESSLVKIPLIPDTYNIEGVSRIRGRFIMPDGFTPKQVKLSLLTTEDQVEQIYNWRFSDSGEDMPQSIAEVPDIDERPIN